MKCVDVWGYKIYEDGTIISLYGKPIKKNKQIKIKYGEERVDKFVSYARFVYYAFHLEDFDFNDITISVRHKNGNEKDFNINNLVAVNRKEYNQGENNVSAKLTNKQVEEIKALYTRDSGIRKDLNDPTAKISYRKLAEKYGVSHTTIRGIITGQFRNKENYVL